MASPYGPWAWTDPFMRPVVHDLILLLLVLTALLLAVSAADVSSPLPFGSICFVVLVMRKGGESS